MKTILFSLILFFAISCATNLKQLSVINVDDEMFEIKPYIIKKDNSFYLIYKIKANGDEIDTRWILGKNILNEKAYYYFVGKSSFREYNNIVEVPLAKDGFTEFALKDSVYWLNPGGTSEKIEIITP